MFTEFDNNTKYNKLHKIRYLLQQVFHYKLTLNYSKLAEYHQVIRVSYFKIFCVFIFIFANI